MIYISSSLVPKFVFLLGYFSRSWHVYPFPPCQAYPRVISWCWISDNDYTTLSLPSCLYCCLKYLFSTNIWKPKKHSPGESFVNPLSKESVYDSWHVGLILIRIKRREFKQVGTWRCSKIPLNKAVMFKKKIKIEKDLR